ncbi:MAG: hypothetical protein CL398_02490 [Acidiferrobacteraceae bacterium]|nr:hypothetical protein [Acidiferrobacteraceae bacterium]
MDYLILILLFLSFMLLIAIHSDFIPWFNDYRRLISHIFPQLLHINSPTKTALTLSCLIIFVGILGRTYTTNDSWIVNAIMFSLIPPLIRWTKWRMARKKKS